MWGAIIALLNSIFSAITTWQVGNQRDADRAAGETKHRADSQEKVLDRVKEARNIERNDLDLFMLRRPKDRNK